MPSMPMHPCPYPGCVELVKRGYCERHAPAAEQQSRQATAARDKARGSASRRGYDRKWRFARAAFLARHPLCVECAKHGLTVPATDVDHIQPHRGDTVLFWQRDNLQALCKACHARKTVRETTERRARGEVGVWGSNR